MAEPSINDALDAIEALINTMDRDDRDGIAGARAAWRAVDNLRTPKGGLIQPLPQGSLGSHAVDKINELVRAVNALRVTARQ